MPGGGKPRNKKHICDAGAQYARDNQMTIAGETHHCFDGLLSPAALRHTHTVNNRQQAAKPGRSAHQMSRMVNLLYRAHHAIIQRGVANACQQHKLGNHQDEQQTR